ncbi:MAG: hypothetical protein DWQ31_19035 [Planctomycetota bacterium]|nr:MAG: hypothetical protein DWQ31_19035 [Planctomycetota bacterium]REJ93181.1 MAG: hypothetical protein DWQ35_10915 [Planctomycetota bacterium]REK23366.1 MAG: hypothetical protein DWQ42_15500 [Planctomycetota bacterium]REK47169.1 MAG: hypothetical protein DWQ46_04880 [Planctomycetota bacterium]
MSIEFQCESCERRLRVADEHAGRQARCPHCRGVVYVPELEDEGDSEDDVGGFPGIGADETAARGGGGDFDFGTSPSKKTTARARGKRPAGKGRGKPSGGRPSSADAERGNLKPHRGVLILVLAILGIVVNCFPLCIAAWVMGNSDVQAMRRGRMDPDGIGLTQAGMIIGMIGTLLALLAVVFFFVIMAMGVSLVGVAI